MRTSLLLSLVNPRGGAPRGQLCFASGLFGGVLGKRRTESGFAAKLPDSLRVVFSDRLGRQRLLPSRAAAMSKVEAVTRGSPRCRISSRVSSPPDQWLSATTRTTSVSTHCPCAISVNATELEAGQAGRQSGGLRSTICGQTSDISRLSWMNSRCPSGTSSSK